MKTSSISIISLAFVFIVNPVWAQAKKQDPSVKPTVAPAPIVAEQEVVLKKLDPQVIIPKEFIASKLKFKKINKNEYYISGVNKKENELENLSLLVFVKSSQEVVELKVKTSVDAIIIAVPYLGNRFDKIVLTDFVIIKTKESQHLKPNLSKNYLAADIGFLSGSEEAAGESVSGSGLKYGVRTVWDFNKWSRLFMELNFSNRESDNANLSGQTSSSLSADAAFQMLDKWNWNLWGFNIIPVAGPGFYLFQSKENLQTGGVSSHNVGALNLLFGLRLQSDKFKTLADVQLKMCMFGCQLSELYDSTTSVYDDAKIMAFVINGTSWVLPWKHWGLSWGLEHLSISAGNAFTNGSTAASKSYSQTQTSFKLGASYHF